MWEDNNNVLGVAMGAVTWVVSGALILINWAKLPPQLPLLYSLPAGEQQLITKPWLLVIWGSFGLLMWLDVMLAWLVIKKEQLLKKYLIWGGVVSEILLLLTLFKVIGIII